MCSLMLEFRNLGILTDEEIWKKRWDLEIWTRKNDFSNSQKNEKFELRGQSSYSATSCAMLNAQNCHSEHQREQRFRIVFQRQYFQGSLELVKEASRAASSWRRRLLAQQITSKKRIQKLRCRAVESRYFFRKKQGKSLEIRPEHSAIFFVGLSKRKKAAVSSRALGFLFSPKADKLGI